MNTVSKEIQSQDYTDWGDFATCKMVPMPNGVVRLMTVYNSKDEQVHERVSEWILLDDNTWESKAYEVDGVGIFTKGTKTGLQKNQQHP